MQRLLGLVDNRTRSLVEVSENVVPYLESTSIANLQFLSLTLLLSITSCLKVSLSISRVKAMSKASPDQRLFGKQNDRAHSGEGRPMRLPLSKPPTGSYGSYRS